MRDEDAQIKREIDEKVKEQLAEERRAIRAELKEEMEERLELKFEPIKRRNGELEKVLAKRYQRDEDACAAVEARGVMQGKAEASTELRLLRTQLKTANDTMADLNRKMEQRTAQFLGEDGEFDLSATLHESCPTDRIQRVKRGQSGPDVIQHVQENRHVCGAPIVWERKNTQGRFNDREWMPKAAKDLSEHGGAFLVIVANKLPAKSELHTKQGSIVVTTPENVAVVACLLRRILIATHGRAAQGVAATVKLRRFFTSGMFNRAIDSVNRELAVWDRTRKERAQKHEKWMAEESGARTRIAHLLVSTSAEIDSILSTDEEVEDRDVG